MMKRKSASILNISTLSRMYRLLIVAIVGLVMGGPNKSLAQTCNSVVNGDFTATTANYTYTTNSWQFDGLTASNYTDGAVNALLKQTVTGLNSGPVANQVTLTFDIGAGNAGNISGNSSATLVIQLGGVTYATFTNPINAGAVTVATANGATIANWTNIPSPIGMTMRTGVQLTIPWVGQSNTADLQFLFSASNTFGLGGDDFLLDNLFIGGPCPNPPCPCGSATSCNAGTYANQTTAFTAYDAQAISQDMSPYYLRLDGGVRAYEFCYTYTTGANETRVAIRHIATAPSTCIGAATIAYSICSGSGATFVGANLDGGTRNFQYYDVLPNTTYRFCRTLTFPGGTNCATAAAPAVAPIVSNSAWYIFNATPPPATFFFNCGSASVSGSFAVGATSSGTLTVPITGTTAGSATFTVSGTGFSGSLMTNLTAGQTSVVIPITYDGTGTSGTKTLTITSAQGSGSCSVTAVVTAAPGGVGNNGYLWFKADSKAFSNAGTTLATDGGNIQEWQNNFGNANVPKMQQTGIASLKPFYRGGGTNLGLNFNPTVDQTSGTWMKSPSSNLTVAQIAGSNTNLTVYSVFKETFGGGTQVVIADHPSNAGQPSAHILYNGLLVSDNCLNNYYSISTSSLGSNPKLFTSIWGGGSGSTSNYVYDRGVVTALSDNDPVASLGTAAQNYMGLGYACGTAYTGTTRVNEFIVYAGNHNAATRNKVESYLAIKWGFTLGTNASTVNYTNSAGTTIWTGDAVYQNNITGIGRDDVSDLLQKQSKSVNSAALVAVGHGNTIATDNISNSNTFSADKSFLLFGDDNTALTWQTTEINAGKKRVTREWKVNETGTVGSVKLQIPDDSSPLSTKLPTESASTIYLVVDADGNFSSGATLIPMTLNGTNWEVNYNFPVGTSYFTVATESIENCTNNIDDDGDGLVDCNDPDCKPTVPRLVIRN